MAKSKAKSGEDAKRTGILVGINPSLNQKHKLTFFPDDTVQIERKPYRSSCTDGWVKHYNILREKVENHRRLIEIIEANPCRWAD